jgi:multiple sugar transport system ATP-binding protein
MAGLSLKNICKIYKGDVKAVDNFNLEIQDKEFIVLVGPSGCGKSTTLRMIAGLEEISAGQLYIDGKVVNDVAPKDRDIAMVFQNYALYPHMSVYDNMAFALKMRKTPKDEIDRRVRAAAKVLELEPYLKRKPKALSGGQRQRVALGRAMVRNPKVFLLDEPLSNLDAKLRVSMRTEISRLHRELNTTFIYVTHDQTEAMTMGTRIVVMKDGVIQQADTPQNLYNFPCNRFVGEFIGSPQMNIFYTTIEKGPEGLYAQLHGSKLKIDEKVASRLKPGSIGREVCMGVRPEDFYSEEAWLAVLKDSSLEVQVELSEAMGSDTYLYFDSPQCQRSVTARVSPFCEAQAGECIKLGIDSGKMHFFDPQTGETLLENRS